ncbi:OmpA family protein [Larkinella rosea]|uniref:OmpA family protein n=1 Tax=Larkinella rosea TaxID=2025312 RepID=A0A3P1B9Q1_9BACT|nr:OmpA family protein [Larkinella rosea]RRA97719.1 OmpA family protein [Larkinella rosea]
MVSFFLLWAYCFSGSAPSSGKIDQATHSVLVSGSCYDVATGVDLKIRAFALYGNRRVNLGQSNDSGIFHLQLPDSTHHLSFELDGYQPATIPVNFLGKVENDANFYVTIPISAKDSLPVKQQNQLYWSFHSPDSLEINYEMKHGKTQRFFTEFNSKLLKKAPYFFLRDIRQGEYVLTASTTDGRLLLRESLTVGPGFNFKSIRIEKPVSANAALSNRPESLPTRSLYFDQSSYELRKETTAALDSISQFLANQNHIVVDITGYTDDVGERKLNLTLSEFRARAVANYLRKKGVPANQIRPAWKGADSPAASNESEETKVKNRRVVLQFSPQ